VGWVGPTVCAAPYTCQALNEWYSQVYFSFLARYLHES